MAYIGAGISRFNTADELTVTGDAQIDTTTLVVDSTNNRVGIGTSSPSTLLHLDASADGRVARFGSGTSDTGGMYVTHNSGSTRSFEVSADNILILDADRSNGRGSSRLQFNVDGSERLRIDSSGNLLVGTTSTTGFQTSSSATGTIAYTGGTIATNVSGDGALYLNRLTSDGDIALFRKDGTTVGSVRSEGGDIVFGNDTRGLKFRDADVIPRDMDNTTADGVVSLGSSTSRFQDLYLSGTAFLSGQSSISGNTASAGSLGITSGHTSSPIRFYTGEYGNTAVERMRIDSSGNLLVGKTSAATNVEGGELRENGQVLAVATNVNPFFGARLGSDGDMAVFRKDSTTVGSIGTEGNDLAIGNDDAGLQFVNNTQTVRPFNMSTNTRLDNAIDLGMSNTRFKDLYLSGGAYIGGTGSANKLDDYEEGTWTPVLRAETTNLTATYIEQVGRYVRVGKLVHVQCRMQGSVTNAGSGARFIDGLPYTNVNAGADTGSGSVCPFNGLMGNNYYFATGHGVNNAASFRLKIQTNLDGTLSDVSSGTGGFAIDFSYTYRSQS